MTNSKQLTLLGKWKSTARAVRATSYFDQLSESFALLDRRIRKGLVSLGVQRLAWRPRTWYAESIGDNRENKKSERLQRHEQLAGELLVFANELERSIRWAAKHNPIIGDRVLTRATQLALQLQFFAIRLEKTGVRAIILDEAEAEIRFRFASLDSAWQRDLAMRGFIAKYGQFDQDAPLEELARKYARYLRRRADRQERKRDEQDDDK